MSITRPAKFLATVTAPLLLMATPAIADCNRLFCTVMNSRNYDLKILNVTPDHAVEFTPITVQFRLSSHVTSVGNVPPPPPDNVMVCPEYKDQTLGTQPCKEYDNFRDDVPVTGTIIALAPIAGDSPTLRINLDKITPPHGGGEFPTIDKLTDDARPYVTSALYKFRLDGFTADQVRSARTDTVWETLFGMVKSDPPHPSDSPDACKIVGANFCLPMTRLENVSEKETVNTSFEIGPFELVPNVANDLRATVLLTNIGDDTWIQEMGEGFANGFSMAGMLALSAYGQQSGNSSAGSTAGQLHAAMEKLHAAEFADCDGQLVEDTFIFPNRFIQSGTPTLDSWTHDDGIENFAPATVYVSNDGNVRCGDDGRYRIRYSVIRTSWKPIQPSD